MTAYDQGAGNQGRNANGKFTRTRPGIRGGASDGEKLDALVKFRVTASQARRASILFYNAKDEKGWLLPADMYRELLDRALTDGEAEAKNPTPQMKANKRRAEMLAKMADQVFRHTEFEREVDRIREAVDLNLRAGDLYACFEMLREYRKEIGDTEDSAIKQRREMEFDKQFGRLWESLQRPVSVNPDDFVNDDK